MRQTSHYELNCEKCGECIQVDITSAKPLDLDGLLCPKCGVEFRIEWQAKIDPQTKEPKRGPMR